MRIENLRKIKNGGIEKSIATVIFENNDRPAIDIYFHTSPEYNQCLSLNPDAFLLAGYLSAMYTGEKRILIEGKVDKDLKKGLLKNMQTFQRWYGRKYKEVSIESDNKDFSKADNSNSHAGLFFSGGVDSIYSLRMNRLKYTSDHHLFVKNCFIVNGFDMNRSADSNENSLIFERAVQSARKITDEAKADLIPVFTNLRHVFYGDRSFWGRWQHGSALAAVGHSFTSAANSMFIASSHAPAFIEPWGSHPLIDPNHSSTSLRMIHDDLCLTIKKLELVSDWETGFQNIRSCYQNDENNMNCCRCEKCVRIMVTLMALGILNKSLAFPEHRVPSLLLEETLREQNAISFKFDYLKLVPFLKRQGYQEIADIILKENRFKSKLKRFDREHLNGKIKKILNKIG